MLGHHPYLLSHHAEKFENVFIENFQNPEKSDTTFRWVLMCEELNVLIPPPLLRFSNNYQK